MLIVVTNGESVHSLSIWMQCDLDRFLLTEGINLKNGFPNCFIARNEEQGVAAGTYRNEITGMDYVFIAGNTYKDLVRAGNEQSALFGCEITRKYSPEMLEALVLDRPMLTAFHGMCEADHLTRTTWLDLAQTLKSAT